MRWHAACFTVWMRALAVVIIVTTLMAGCVLPRPHHRKALTVNGLGLAAGIGFLVADAIDCRDAGPDGCHVHDGGFSPNNLYGEVLVVGSLALLVATLVVAEIQGAPAPRRAPPTPRP